MNIDTCGLSENSVKRGERLVAAGRVEQDSEHPTIWWVRSERVDQTTPYRVQADIDPVTGEFSWVTCTCQHGLTKGGGRATCYHVAAALLLAEKDRAEAGSEPDEDDDEDDIERFAEMRAFGEHPLGFDTMKEVRGDA